jgi:hypothetical protein
LCRLGRQSASPTFPLTGGWLQASLAGATAFLAPEIRTVGRVQVARMMAGDKALAPYRKDIEAILR